MFAVPSWTTWLLALVLLPVVIGAVIYLYVDRDSGSRVERHSEEGDDPPDTAGDGPEELLAAA